VPIFIEELSTNFKN